MGVGGRVPLKREDTNGRRCSESTEWRHRVLVGVPFVARGFGSYADCCALWGL